MAESIKELGAEGEGSVVPPDPPDSKSEFPIPTDNAIEPIFEGTKEDEKEIPKSCTEVVELESLSHAIDIFDVAEVIQEFANSFNPGEIHFFLKLFRKANTAGNGQLSSEELVQFLDLHDYVISTEESQRIILETDDDSDGRLNFKEFLALCRKAHVNLTRLSPSLITLTKAEKDHAVENEAVPTRDIVEESLQEGYIIRNIFQAIFQTVGFMPSIKETVQFFEKKIAELSRYGAAVDALIPKSPRKQSPSIEPEADHLEDVEDASQVPILDLYSNQRLPSTIDSTSLLAIERTLLAESQSLRQMNRENSPFDYDLIVIGSNSGGYGVAKEASRLGKTTLVIDFNLPSPLIKSWGWRYGPSCVNVGCVPKSLFFHTGLLREILGEKKAMLPFGLFFEKDPCETGEYSFNWSTLIDNIQGHIQTLSLQRQEELERRGIQFINARCEFESSHNVFVKRDGESEGEIISAEKIVIAVQSLYQYLDIPGSHGNCITVDDIWSLRNHPGKTLIIGGGPDALEAAGLLCALKIDVTIMSRSPVLKGYDRGMVTLLLETLHRRGLKQMFDYTPTEVKSKPSSENLNRKTLIVFAKHIGGSGESCEKEFDTIVLAVGKKPATPILKLEKADILVDDKNSKIWVDSENMTTVEDVFAVGDCSSSSDECLTVNNCSDFLSGVVLGRRLFSASDPDISLSPSSSPPQSNSHFHMKLLMTPVQYGCIGMTEEEVIFEHGEANVLVYHAKFQPIHYQLSNRRDYCYAKMLTLKSESERVLGLHYLGPNAGDVLGGFSIALKLGATKADLESLRMSHPISAEVFTRMTPTTESSKEMLRPLPTL